MVRPPLRDLALTELPHRGRSFANIDAIADREALLWLADESELALRADETGEARDRRERIFFSFVIVLVECAAHGDAILRALEGQEEVAAVRLVSLAVVEPGADADELVVAHLLLERLRPIAKDAPIDGELPPPVDP